MKLGVFSRLSEIFLEENQRWILWLPVGLGVGIGVYFNFRFEPPLYSGLLLLLLLLGIGWIFRGFSLWLGINIIILVIFVGFTAAQWRSFYLHSPLLEKRIGQSEITGQIGEIGLTPKGNLKISLERLEIPGIKQPPFSLRIHLPKDVPDIKPGDWLKLKANLNPNSPPSLPGGYDFQRQAYLTQLGGAGRAWGEVKIIHPPYPDGLLRQLEIKLAEIRYNLTIRIIRAIGGEEGAIAAALITGEKGGISYAMTKAYRDSGLAHLLAISGMNIALAAGLIFVVIRKILVMIPGIGLRLPIKKITAILAIIAAFIYLLLSGSSIPAQRAFLMAAIALFAVALDREALSLRTCAISAAILLLWEPESLIMPGFQMSYAAIVGLAALYEWLARYSFDWRARWYALPLLYLGSVGITTLVASIATLPFGIYHFNRVSVYGILANLLAVPLNGLWIMPFAVIALLLLPFGLDQPFWRLIGLGVDLTNQIAHEVASWPGAAFNVPSLSLGGLLFITLGILWFGIWQQKWRIWGLPAAFLGFFPLFITDLPDIIVANNGELAAIRDAKGGLVFTSGKDKRTQEAWLAKEGENAPPRKEANLRRCDNLGCIYSPKGWQIAFPSNPLALADDCEKADLIVAPFPIRRACPRNKAILDRFDLWRNGAYAIWLNSDKKLIKSESVNGLRGNRPWVIPKPLPGRDYNDSLAKPNMEKEK